MCETVGSICFTCLSTNRNILPIKEHKNAIQNWTKINVTDDCKICWECAATFRRIENFKIQVVEASTLFHKFIQQKIMTFPTLSKLKYVTNFIFDNFYNDILKDETNISDNDSTVGDDNDNTVTDDIKIESNELEESPYNTIKIEPYDGKDTVYLEIDNIERTDDSFDTPSGFGHVICDYRNEAVTENMAVHDYNTTDTVANNFVSNVNISNQIEGIPLRNAKLQKFDDSKVKKKVRLLVDMPNLNKEICIKNTYTLSNDSEQQTEYRHKINSVKVCDRYVIVTISEEEMLEERRKERESDLYRRTIFKCDTCIIGYTAEVHYMHHRRNLHSETLQMKCHICECTFHDASSLDVHKEGHYRIYQCSECNFRHIRSQRVVDHYGKHHLNQEFYTCSTCQKKLRSKSKLIHHRSQAHESVAACEICGKQCANKQSFKLHMLVHTGKPRYECEICNKYYRGKSGLASHMKNIHGNTKSEEAYCNICDVQFKKWYIYKAHMRTVHSSQSVECGECGKQFVHKTYLFRHIKFTHSMKRLSCKLCTKTFSRPESLRMHTLEVHEKKQSIKGVCEICAKPMKSKRQLREHLNTHTGSRPYKCEKCSSTFKHKSALYMHIKLVHYKLKRSDKVKIVLKEENKIN